MSSKLSEVFEAFEVPFSRYMYVCGLTFMYTLKPMNNLEYGTCNGSSRHGY